MLFYLYKDPPDCTLNLETVESFILGRLQSYSLSYVLQYDTEEFNYYDMISHLFMCIITIDYPYFKDLFINGEIRLFQQRLKCINFSEIKRELSKALEYLSNLLQNEEFRKLKSMQLNQFQLVQNLILAVLSKSGHSFKRCHSKNCRKYKLTLPFTFPLKLIAKRKVEVRNGKVSLSCGQWNEILEMVFEFLLKVELLLLGNCENLKKYIYDSEDDRVRQIIRRCTNFLSGSWTEGKEGVLMADEIDNDSLYFPPCMAGLHQILRHSHRLSYDSRFQYMLFLKDIGLSVTENVLFWETEYRKPHAGSSCTHDWQKNEIRYKYQIQHLYGLIGNHGFKSSHSCDKFIQELLPKMDGGCPFQHLTSEQLADVMPASIMTLPDVEDIFTNKYNGLPQRACAEYLNRLQTVLCKQGKKENIRKLFNVVSPLQFYHTAKNL